MRNFEFKTYISSKTGMSTIKESQRYDDRPSKSTGAGYQIIQGII
jgi:hypothetical protein